MIGAISSIVGWALEKIDPLFFRRVVARMDNGSCELLVIQKILEVDWYVTFAGKAVINMGWYLYYDYQTGRVDCIPSWTWSGAEVFPEIVPKFHPGCRTTLANCEADARRYASEQRRQYQEASDARTRWEAAEKRTTPVTALWRNSLTACGLQVPTTGGEGADHVVTVPRGQQAAQEEIRTLKVQFLKACAGSNDFTALFVHSRRELEEVARERHASRHTLRQVRAELEALRNGSSSSSAVAKAKAKAAFNLAQVAVQLQEVMDEGRASYSTR